MVQECVAEGTREGEREEEGEVERNCLQPRMRKSVPRLAVASSALSLLLVALPSSFGFGLLPYRRLLLSLALS